MRSNVGYGVYRQAWFNLVFGRLIIFLEILDEWFHLPRWESLYRFPCMK